MAQTKTKSNTKKRTSTNKAAAVKTSKKKATPKRASSRKTVALSKAIVETSPITWSHNSIGPTFEEIQLAAYHKWLQHGGSDLDNWTGAENDLRRGND